MTTSQAVSRVLKSAKHERSTPNGRWDTTAGFKVHAGYTKGVDPVVVSYTPGSWCRWDQPKRQAAQDENLKSYTTTLEAKGFTVVRQTYAGGNGRDYLEVTK